MKRRRRQHRSAAVCSASARGRVRRACRRAQGRPAGSTPVRGAQHSSGNPRRLACSWHAGSHVMEHEAMEATSEVDARTLADVATHRWCVLDLRI